MPEAYVRLSELAKILGWRRPSVYYWLHRCQIEPTIIGGHFFIPVEDLPTVTLTLQEARKGARSGSATR